VIEATEKQLLELLDNLAYGTASTLGLKQTRRLWISRRQARQTQYSKEEKYPQKIPIREWLKETAAALGEHKR
jgi:hypothetical protein